MKTKRKKEAQKAFIRDGRAPIPEKEITSKVMSSIKGKDTMPELTLRRALRRAGMGGYRIHWKKVPGCPDICYPGRKIAIFVNGCFWHRCPYCMYPLPKAHTTYWKDKFKRNVERDKRRNQELHNLGWSVLTVWECKIKKELCAVVRKIEDIYIK